VSEVLPAAVVSAETIAALEDTLTLRAVVDVGIARRAASTDLTAADRERLWQAHLECASAEYPSGYHRADARFHLVLAELLGSASTTRLAADIRLRLDELLSEVPLLVPSVEHSDLQHRQIADAILRSRPEEAAEIMAVHVDGTAALLRGFFA
jgi:DNA-binding GntR family transcriptional regulator